MGALTSITVEPNTLNPWLIYPGQHRYPAREKITVWPLQDVAHLLDEHGGNFLENEK